LKRAEKNLLHGLSVKRHHSLARLIGDESNMAAEGPITPTWGSYSGFSLKQLGIRDLQQL
jgi:hypothetical protein